MTMRVSCTSVERVKAVLDTKRYETGVKPSAEEIEKLRLHPSQN